MVRYFLIRSCQNNGDLNYEKLYWFIVFVVLDLYSGSAQGNSQSTISHPDFLFPLAAKNFIHFACKNLDIRIVVGLFIIREFNSSQRMGRWSSNKTPRIFRGYLASENSVVIKDQPRRSPEVMAAAVRGERD
jgi:hypothetical protein